MWYVHSDGVGYYDFVHSCWIPDLTENCLTNDYSYAESVALGQANARTFLYYSV